MTPLLRPRDRHNRATAGAGALAAIVLAVTMLGSAARAHAADSAGGGDEDAALRRGFELREKGSDEAALAEFQRAYDVKKGARARAQMALAEQALGRWIDAEAHLAEALQRTADPWIARNRTLLDEALVEIRQHIGSLELSGGTPGAEVRVNGRVAGRMPLDRPLRVEAGSVSLEVRAAGYLPVIRTINVPANGLAREPITLVAASAAAGVHAAPEMARTSAEQRGAGAAAPSGAEPANDSHGPSQIKRPLGIGLGIAGIGALGVGVGFHLLRQSRASDFNRDCMINAATGAISGTPGVDCQSRYDGVQQARNIAIGGYVAAPILLGLAAYALFSSSSPGEPSPADHRAASRHRTASPPQFACAPSAASAITCAATF
jgi:hypothetical protein